MKDETQTIVINIYAERILPSGNFLPYIFLFADTFLWGWTMNRIWINTSFIIDCNKWLEWL